MSSPVLVIHAAPVPTAPKWYSVTHAKTTPAASHVSPWASTAPRMNGHAIASPASGRSMTACMEAKVPMNREKLPILRSSRGQPSAITDANSRGTVVTSPEATCPKSRASTNLARYISPKPSMRQ